MSSKNIKGDTLLLMEGKSFPEVEVREFAASQVAPPNFLIMPDLQGPVRSMTLEATSFETPMETRKSTSSCPLVLVYVPMMEETILIRV